MRDQFAETHQDVLLLNASDAAAVAAFLLERRLATRDELPARVERAGEGNMNLTLRVTLQQRSVILKQGRPWVEKYDHIAAPWERTVIEGRFYEAVRGEPAVSDRMPALLALDPQSHVIVLEDLGAAGDLTSMYSGRPVLPGELRGLLAWLAALGRVVVPGEFREDLANRAMRRLNHEHIFRFPLLAGNDLNLDGITAGLGAAADELVENDFYVSRVNELGAAYLADRSTLVHGDYFPGSWVHTAAGIRIIDPEFGFLGAREFDYGVLLAHLALARADISAAREVLSESRSQRLDQGLLLGFAGAEIMRRLIGVAQLPLPYGLDTKRRLLELSRVLVLSPERELACW